MKNVKRLIVLMAILVMGSASSMAQSKYFKTEAEAISYLNKMCNKYWVKTMLKDEASFDIKVYTNDCDLYFEIKDYFECKPGDDKPCIPKVLNTLMKINMEEVTINGKSEEIILTGGKKAITTLSYINTTGWEQKAENSNTLTIPLQYKDATLKDINDKIKDAFIFMVAKCRDQNTK